MNTDKKDYWIYTATNKSKYIQTHNSYLAHAIVYMVGVKFYKITIEGRVVHSFEYSDSLLEVCKVIEQTRECNKYEK